MKPRLSERPFAYLLAAFVAVQTAHAQTAAFTAQGGQLSSDTVPGTKTVRALFNAADQNRDGQLTRIEARWRLPLTHHDFARIDTGKRGWISFEQFMEYIDQRVAKQADDIVQIGNWARMPNAQLNLNLNLANNEPQSPD